MMDNDLTEHVLWPKLPGTEEFFFSPFTSYKGQERKSCGCGRKMEQGSGVFDTVKGSHVGD